MKTVRLRILLFVVLLAVSSGRLFCQEIDPKVVATLVTQGKVTFDPNSKITVWLDEKQNYSISSASARTASQLSALGGPPLPPPPPPLPKPPTPVNHTGPRPPMPVPKPPKPKTKAAAQIGGDLLQQAAQQGVIVGELKTEGVSQSNWKLEKGTYTMVLTTLDGKPIATLVNSKGEFVLSFDNILFVNAK